ncbi:cellulose biosynthesis protein BcsC [Sphaerotilus mobilis]|uniref:Tfp pilus assembly protein PilF n=1 Tax=Sphaerotilus mobilis TaxID=47994 RepID=A0A4Q7LL36_9BURK|nr:cellulose biosynthesis protein BcsC [Sphaerotilus mobilis]RZS54567.1 Tfp pilus assembly protein PilF [Sphaerotilus mobilis]
MTPRLTALAAALALAGLTPSLPLAATTNAPAATPATATPTTADSPAVRTLIAQARRWQERGRADLAASAWRKLLAFEPQHAEALQGLAQAQIDLGQTEAANDTLATLRRSHPDSPALRRLEARQREGKAGDSSQLQKARQFASAGQYDAAARQYELLLADPNPQGALAVEYYQTLAGTARWDEARRGLERLAQADPDDVRTRLALAKVLSYREPSRRDAIARLATLSQTPDAGGVVSATTPSPAQRQEAREAWRQSLLWLTLKPTDSALLRDHLEQAGEDSAVRGRLDELLKGSDEARRMAEARERDPLVRSRRQGFDALQGGELDAAAERFTKLLQARPKDSDALGGLGVVRLRQARYGEARELLGQAVALSGDARSPWHKAHVNAQVRVLLQQAETARSAGRHQTALDTLRQATVLDARDPLPWVEAGDVQAELGHWAAAEGHYRTAQALEPPQPDAWRGWVRAMHAQRRGDEARVAIDALPDTRAGAIGGREPLLAMLLQQDAAQSQQRGELARAESQLDEALRLNPQDPWLRLSLAQLLTAQGRTEDARWLMDDLAAQNPRRADAWWALAQWQADLQQPAAGLQALDRIAPADRRPEMARLHRQLRVQLGLAQARELGAQGQSVAALAALQRAQTDAGREPELLASVGNAYGEAGQTARGLQLLRTALSQERGQAGTRDPGARLQYAQLLDNARQDSELAGLLPMLASQPLSPSQRDQLDGLRVGLTLRQVDRLREAGDTAGAYEQLEPLLNERPGDVRLALALARLHVAVGDPAQALDVVDAVLASEPANLDAWLARASAATAADDAALALASLEEASRLSPNNPRVLAEYARHHRARGELRLAADYLRAAIAAQRPAGTRAPLRRGLGDRSNDRITEPALDRPAEPSRAWGRPIASDLPPAMPALEPLLSAPTAASGSTSAQALGHQPPTRPLRGSIGTATGSPQTGQGGTGSLGTSSLGTATDAWLRGAGAEPAAGAPTGNGLANAPRDEVRAWDAGPRPSRSPAPSLASPNDLLADLPPTGAGRPDPSGMAAPRSVQTAAPLVATSPLVNTSPLAVTPRSALPKGLNDELAEVLAERGSRAFEGGAALRWRSGDSGTSQLVDLRAPVGFQTPVGDVGRLTLQAVPTMLEAGAPGQDDDAAGRFGSQALGGTRSAESVSASGVGLSIGLAGRMLAGDIGVTPLGFPVVNVVGGLRVGGLWGNRLGYGAEVSRRAVTDSVLSWAGVRDPRTGQVWGGVTATGVQGSLNWRGDDGLQLLARAGVHLLAGEGVRNNSRIELGAGTRWRSIDEPGRRLEWGLDLNYTHHAENLRHFTLGHGGYFSPQQSITLSAPIALMGQRAGLRWGLNVAPGLQAWREDSAPYYPQDGAAQQQLSNAVTLGQATSATHVGRSSIGLSIALQGAAEYRLGPQLALGSRLALDNAADYTQMSGGLYLRVSLDPDSVASPLRMPGSMLD